MTRKTVQAWYLVHKWTSLVCTAFLLMLCVTGLPLIFAEEIHHLSGAEPELAAAPSGAEPANLDSLIEKARAQYPGQVPLFKSEEHTSELQSLMRTSYAVFCVKKKTSIHK